MRKEPKTIAVKIIQGNYGDGWTDLCEYDANDNKTLKTDFKTYVKNETNAQHRIITRRVPNPKYVKKILSVDWDYFQNVSADTLRNCYPDGYDAPTDISEMTWGAHYAEKGDDIEKVSLSNEYNTLRDILARQRRTTPVMVANSHAHIYNFIAKYTGAHEQVNIVNVDMHHDIANGNTQLDCGNWIQHIIKRNNLSKQNLKWIHNPVSFEAYTLGTDCDNAAICTINDIDGGTSLDAIKNEKYDLIFIARSDQWSPPHLDDYFSDVVDNIAAHFKTVTIEQSVCKPRKQYEQVRDMIAKKISAAKNETASSANAVT